MGTIYRHFQNKEELIGAVQEKWLAHVRLRNAGILAASSPPESKLYDLVVVHVARLSELIRSDQAAFELLMGALRLRYIGCDTPDVRRQIFDAMIESAAAVFAEGTASGKLRVDDVDRAARHFIEAFAEYLSPAEVIRRPHAEIVEGAEGMFEFLMRGIRAHPEDPPQRAPDPKEQTG